MEKETTNKKQVASNDKADKKKLSPMEEADLLKKQMDEIQKKATERKKKLSAKRMKLMAESAESYKNRVDKAEARLKKISKLTDYNLVSCNDEHFDNTFGFLKNAVTLYRARNQKQQN